MQLFFSAEDREDFVGDVAVLLRAGEFAGAGAVGEQGDHHRGVTLGGEDAEGVAVFGFGLGEDRGAGLVVGADDHEGVAVALGEADGGLDGLVEVEGFLDGAREVVGVLALVDAGAFDHQEKSLLAAGGEVLDGHLRGGGQVVTAVQGHGLREVEQALGACDGRVLGVVDHGVAAADGFLRGEGTGLVGVLRAGRGEGQRAGREVGPDLFLHAAGGLVGEEGRRRGAVEVVGGEYAAGVAQRGEDLGDVGDALLGGVDAEVAVVGLLAGGVGRAGGGGVGGEVVGGLGPHEAEGAQVGHRELAAVGVHGGVDGAVAHAVADQQDDVAHALVGAVDLEVRGVGALFLDVGIAGRGLDFAVLRLGGEGDRRAQRDGEEEVFQFHGYGLFLLVLSFVRNLGAGVLGGVEGDVLLVNADAEVAQGDGYAMHAGLDADRQVGGFGDHEVHVLGVVLVGIVPGLGAAELPDLVGLALQAHVVALRDAVDHLLVALGVGGRPGLAGLDRDFVLGGFVLPVSHAVRPVDDRLVLDRGDHLVFVATGVHRRGEGAEDRQADLHHHGETLCVEAVRLAVHPRDDLFRRLGGKGGGGQQGREQQGEESFHDKLLFDNDFVDEDEAGAAGAGVPLWDGADVLGEHLDVACAHVGGHFAVPDAHLVVALVHGVFHARERREMLPVLRDGEFHVPGHPDPGAGVLAEARADGADVPHGEQVHHGFEVGVLVALPAAGAPVEAAAEAVDQAFVAAGRVLAAVAGADVDGAVAGDLVHGAAGGEAAAVADLGVGFHRAGFADGEGAFVGAELVRADAVPDPAFAGEGHAGAVGEDVVVQDERRIGDDRLGEAGEGGRFAGQAGE